MDSLTAFSACQSLLGQRRRRKHALSGAGQVNSLKARVKSLEAKLAGVTRGANTLRFSGMNVQVVNGTGSESKLNGRGNLIVGYNANASKRARKGSHNLVVGIDHGYGGHDGFVAGSVGHRQQREHRRRADGRRRGRSPPLTDER